MGAGVRLRLCAWTAALLLPVAPAPAMLTIHALGVPSPFATLEPVLAAPPRITEPAMDLAAPSRSSLVSPLAPHIPIAALILGLAGLGAALRLGQLGLGLRRVARLVADAEEIGDPDLAARLGRGVRLGDTQVPLLAGLLRPTILLPRRLLASLTAEQAVLVCAHERAHLAAGDHLSHLMEEVMVRLFWFNPFMAAARERLAAAREESCDARALAGRAETQRRAYAQALIAALKLASHAEPVAAFTGFRRRGAERRLKAILAPARPCTWRALAAALLAGVGLTAAVGGVSLAAATPPSAQDSGPPGPRLPPLPPLPPAPLAAPAASANPGRPYMPRHHHQDHWGHHVMIMDGNGGGYVEATPEEREQARAAASQAIAESRQAMAEASRQMAEAHMLTAQDRERIHQEVEQALKASEAARQQAMQAAATAREAALKGIPRGFYGPGVYGPGFTREDGERIRQQARTARNAARAAAIAQNDGRVIMSCKLGADGKAEDCVKL